MSQSAAAVAYELFRDREDKHEVRGAAMRIESAKKSLESWTVFRESSFSLLGANCCDRLILYHHVCRGRTDGQDELFNRILKSLTKFYVELRMRLEGGKITAFTRARVALKRMLHRLGGK